MAEITLRAMCAADESAAVSILRSEKVAETFMLPQFTDDAQAAALFRRLLTLSRGGEVYVRGAYDGAQLVGFINQVDLSGDTVEVGYVVAPDKWGRGYATAMLRGAISELFGMGYAVVRCGYFAGNDASRRVMEKCGMIATDETEEIDYRGKRHLCLYRMIARG